MTEGTKRYNLEDRTFDFARQVVEFVSAVPETIANRELVKQVVRSSGSVGANYIEANEALGKKDFAMRIKICRKEAKESRYWLRLLQVNADPAEATREALVNEATELMRIFGSIVEKTK